MGKYLDFYKKCMDDGSRLPWWSETERCNGLCPAFYMYMDDGFAELKSLFEPELPEGEEENDINRFWGSGDPSSPRMTEFTSLRQNIVLFLAAMNNENFDDL
jgi:hypothetical protein